MTTHAVSTSGAAKPAELESWIHNDAVLKNLHNVGDVVTTDPVLQHPLATQVAPSLQDLMEKLCSRAREASVKKLLADAAKLREWQKAARPTHAQRDAMMKTGSHWNVRQKSNGKKRKPEHVAEDLEMQFIGTAQRLLKNKRFFNSKPARDSGDMNWNTLEVGRTACKGVVEGLATSSSSV